MYSEVGNSRFGFIEKTRFVLTHEEGQQTFTRFSADVVNEVSWELQLMGVPFTAGLHPRVDHSKLSGYVEASIIGCFDPAGSRHPEVDPRNILPALPDEYWESGRVETQAGWLSFVQPPYQIVAEGPKATDGKQLLECCCFPPGCNAHREVGSYIVPSEFDMSDPFCIARPRCNLAEALASIVKWEPYRVSSRQCPKEK